MNEKINGQFNRRAFVSVLAGLTFVVMAVTGLVMFVAPSCRIARDTGWTVLGFNKDQWSGVHVWFSIAFVIASAFHIYLNWAALICYFKNKLRRGFALRAEWVSALAICGIIYAGTIYDVAPFSSLVGWKESFRREGAGAGAGGQGWRGGRAALQSGPNYFGASAIGTASRSGEPGDGQVQCGAGETALKACDSESGHESSCAVQDLAAPQQPTGSCEQGAEQGPGASRGGFGIGQKTLSQFCADEGVDLSWAISRFRDKGVSTQETTTMREIADKVGVHPRELRTLLQAQ